MHCKEKHTSSVGPYLFLMPLTSRKAWWRSPSMYITVSTMCSNTLGPAMSPADRVSFQQEGLALLIRIHFLLGTADNVTLCQMLSAGSPTYASCTVE